MQKIATKVFTWASVVFGVLGIIIVITAPGADTKDTTFDQVVVRLLVACGFVVLSSFALSVAGKYLSNK